MNLRRQKLAAAVVRTAIPLLLALTGMLAGAAQGAWAGSDPTSGLPVPRFVSLKADRVTVRGGPDKDHDVSWIYTRVGWPVEITAEFENWRRIRDADGSEGWVYHSLLSGKRTGAVQMKVEDRSRPASCQARRPEPGHGAIAGRGSRHRQALHRRLVRNLRRGLRRLDRAERAVGRLPEREVRVVRVRRVSRRLP